MRDQQSDPDGVKMFSFNVFSQLSGAVTAGMIHLGDSLGLYTALADADGPLSAAELADRTALDQRWVLEWVSNQAAARLVSVEDDRFSLSPEAVQVLATPDSEAYGMGMFHRFPSTMAALEEMPESFRTGLGHDYDSHGAEGAVGIERSFEPWNRHHLIPTVLPALEGMVERLETGVRVSDVGCGAGGAVLMMAERFPHSSFTGYDISRHALDRAEARASESGVGNAHFGDPRDEPLPSDHSVDLITTFDCIHDMTDPQGVIDAIREAISDDGTWLLVDIKGRDTLAENLEKNPMAALMYGISVLSCMSSALSAPNGAGLGTLGLPESKAREMAEQAGFTRFRRLDIDHAINAFYEVRP
ncbi:MAG: class I SAM-dependent methyltransferase [Acidimicrobiia bacterium]|nr:class I SAM-dependent methyltransferase [Acidimicrobiia bacterium]